MTAKTKKEFQAENSDLRKRLNMVTINFDKLSEDHKSLQTKVILEKEKKHVCKRCDENLESVNDVRKHRSRASIEVFKCDQCMKEFDQMWKMRAHEKKHKKYQCDKCERSFEYQDILKKHKLVSHENTKLYCHFFNNEKTCPYNDKCIFLHADSKFCRYDSNFERDLCMFKHRREKP